MKVRANLSESLFGGSMEKPEKELAAELAEVVVDAVLQDDLLKDIPVVSTLVNLTKLPKSSKRIDSPMASHGSN